MASTNFIDYQTTVVADWLNDVNTTTYSEHVNVTFYGVVGDGVTNNNVALAAALAEAGDGRTVYFPPGDYLITGSGGIAVPEGVSIFMEPDAWLIGDGTTLTNFLSPQGRNRLTVNIDGRSLPAGGVQDTWNQSAGSAVGISSHSSTSLYYGIDDVILVNCVIKNLQYAVFTEGASRWRIVNNYFYNLRNSAIQMGGKEDYDCILNLIAHNQMYNCGDYAVAFYSTDSVNKGSIAYNITTNNIAFEMQLRTNGYAFGVEAGDPVYQHSMVFSGNTYWSTIAGTAGGNGGITISTCADSAVVGNMLIGRAATGSIGEEVGINCTGFGGFTSERNLIADNSISYFSAHGIRTDGANYTTIRGNVLLNCGFTSSSNAALEIASEMDVAGTVVDGNTLRITSGYPSYGAGTPSISCVKASGKTVTDISITNNTIVNPNDLGILLTGNTRPRVSDNTIIGLSPGSFFQREPIYLDDCTELQVSNNTITNALRGFQIINSTSGVVENNYFRGTETVATLYTLTASTGLRIRNNSQDVTVTTALAAPTTVVSDPGNNNKVTNDTKIITENRGVTSAIATGATVAHGLTFTPTVVQVTAAESGPTDIYVTSVGGTNFTVNFGGGGSKTFYWKAEV